MTERQRRPKVNTLPVGTRVGQLTIRAHNLEEKTVNAYCHLCCQTSWLPALNFYARVGCGCTSNNTGDPLSATHSERTTVIAMNTRVREERERYIPVQLREVWRYRDISPRWHEDNPDKYINFIHDVGHRPPGARAALLDPAGDFTPENFYWKLNDRSNSKEDTRAVPEGETDLI